MFIFRYGYTNFRYVSSLISGVGIFCVGAGFAWYHGIAGILNRTDLVDMTWVSTALIYSLCVHTLCWNYCTCKQRAVICQILCVIKELYILTGMETRQLFCRMFVTLKKF